MWHNSCILDMQVSAEPVGGLQLMQDSFCWGAAKAAVLNLQGRAASSVRLSAWSSHAVRITACFLSIMNCL